MVLQVVFRKLVVLSKRKVKKSQGMWNKLGILMLSNACVCEQAQRQERADLLQDWVFKQTRERSSAHSRGCYTGACILGPAPSPQNMTSPPSCCQLSCLKAYRTGTELAPYWHPYCVTPACIATTMLTLAQICDDSLPLSSDFSSTPPCFPLQFLSIWQPAVTFSSHRDENILVLHL